MKGLEALNRIRKVNYCEYDEEIIEDCYGIEKDLSIIEKELKALEIIRNKKVAHLLIWLMERHTKKSALRLYNEPCDEDRKLTKEEYDLLKEVLL